MVDRYKITCARSSNNNNDGCIPGLSAAKLSVTSPTENVNNHVFCTQSHTKYWASCTSNRVITSSLLCSVCVCWEDCCWQYYKRGCKYFYHLSIIHKTEKKGGPTLSCRSNNLCWEGFEWLWPHTLTVNVGVPRAENWAHNSQCWSCINWEVMRLWLNTRKCFCAGGKLCHVKQLYFEPFKHWFLHNPLQLFDHRTGLHQ